MEEVLRPRGALGLCDLRVFSTGPYIRMLLEIGKKIWELLVVDATGQWREAVRLPATGVNSVAVREAVEGVIARAPVKPTVIRFFRMQMRNMLTIALGGVAAERPTLRVVSSRATHAIYDWLEERERDVYPQMEGYSGAPQVVRDRMTAPTTPATCCTTCKKGKACGNSCISAKKTCHKPKGCACDAPEA